MRWLGYVSGGILLAVLAVYGYRAGAEVFSGRDPLEGLPRAEAMRTDLHVTLNAFGDIQSAQKTLIECELDRLSVGSSGGRLSADGFSTIIEIIPDGSMVEEGQVLARLDASQYVELVRQQEIKVLQANADLEKARLDLEAKEIALREYQEGSLAQQRESFQEQRVLYESDIQRQTDRIAWAEEMFGKGYLSEGKVLDERDRLLRSRINLARVETQLANLEDYTAPMQIKQLEAAVERAREEHSYQKLRVMRRNEQLQKFKDQVDACTIRAPHPGMVIYANDDDDDDRIELGAQVRRHMDLFYLPDLGRMEVHAIIHESVMRRVEAGQPALVRVEGLPQYTLEGHVSSVSPLPIPKKSWRESDEIKNFLAKVQVHSPPPGLLPGMTAEVEIRTMFIPDALVVPTESVTVEGGKEFLYVAGDNGLERRRVEIAPGTPDFIQVLGGLAEGEVVVAEPSRIDPALAMQAPVTEGPSGRPDGAELAETEGLDAPVAIDFETPTPIATQ